MDNSLDHVWAEKYRPHTVEDLIASDDVKALVQGIIDKKIVPNLLLVGPSGIGKTSIAKLIMEVLGYDYIFINGSLDGNIDTLRNRIQQFASTISFGGGRKYVLFDEADYSNQQSTQPALRSFIETFSANCGFIFTANYGNRIIGPLRERLQQEEFRTPKSEYPKLAMMFTKRVHQILEAENVLFEKEAVARLVMGNTPNWRAVLIKLQQYANKYGKIDAGILAQQVNVSIQGLVKPLFQDKDYPSVRKWVAQNVNTDVSALFTTLAEALPAFVQPQSVGDLIIILARYQYQAAFVADQQINLAACLAEIMASCLAK